MSLIKPVGKIKWGASTSPDVVGYRIFWTDDDTFPTYESRFVDVGNVTEVQLPLAGMEAIEDTLTIGIAAVDTAGNVSDISSVVDVPLDAVAPEAPSGVVYVIA